MDISHTLGLRKQVLDFVQWAETVNVRHGEWECDYESWGTLLSAALGVISAFQTSGLAAEEADDLLYALARDNEAEVIREALLSSPALLTQLARLAVTSSEADARWQVAVSVAEAQLPNAAELMRPFLSDESEYVRRRTLMAFAPIAPQEAEALALRDLDDGYEYTRLAALEVLQLVNYSRLNQVIDRMRRDDSECVRNHAEGLRQIQRKHGQ